MAKSNSKAPQTKQTKSFILTLALVLLVGYFVITIIGLQFSIKERQDVLEQKNAVYEEQVEENTRLQTIVDSEDKSEYMEQIAREKLGFIKPNEKVFYDVTPGV
jgi:cell division protein FtsB